MKCDKQDKQKKQPADDTDLTLKMNDEKYF